MEQQVRYRISLALITCQICLSSCNNKEKDNTSPDIPVYIHSTDTRLLFKKNAVCYLDSIPFSGIIFTLSENGTDTIAVMSYMEGKEHGVWKKLYDNGTIKEERTFKNGEKEGTLAAWWPDGNKKMEYHFLRNEYHGTCREWNQQGILTKEMNYNMGKESGSQKIFYDNGKIKANYVVTDGRQYGLIGTKNCINVSDSIYSK